MPDDGEQQDALIRERCAPEFLRGLPGLQFFAHAALPGDRPAGAGGGASNFSALSRLERLRSLSAWSCAKSKAAHCFSMFAALSMLARMSGVSRAIFIMSVKFGWPSARGCHGIVTGAASS